MLRLVGTLCLGWPSSYAQQFSHLASCMHMPPVRLELDGAPPSRPGAAMQRAWPPANAAPMHGVKISPLVRCHTAHAGGGVAPGVRGAAGGCGLAGRPRGAAAARGLPKDPHRWVAGWQGRQGTVQMAWKLNGVSCAPGGPGSMMTPAVCSPPRPALVHLETQPAVAYDSYACLGCACVDATGR